MKTTIDMLANDKIIATVTIGNKYWTRPDGQALAIKRLLQEAQVKSLLNNETRFDFRVRSSGD